MIRSGLAVPVDEADHVLGTAGALVTVVEYADFECPYCADAAPGIRLMLARYAGRVRFAFRHFPLDIHPHALAAAEAAESAAGQGKFWQMHDLLYRHQKALRRLELDRHAHAVNLDPARFGKEMDSHVHHAKIRAQANGGKQSGVRSTPGIFVNGTRLDVAFDLQNLYDAIDAELR